MNTENLPGQPQLPIVIQADPLPPELDLFEPNRILLGHAASFICRKHVRSVAHSFALNENRNVDDNHIIARPVA